MSDLGPGDANAATSWLRTRVERTIVAAAQTFLRETAEALSIASGDGVSIRVVSADGLWLLPVAVHHPNPIIHDAMRDAMERTTEKTNAGVWEPVVSERRIVTYDLTEQPVPPEASPSQAEFIRTYPVTHIMGAPVLRDDTVVGGVSLVRYVERRSFSAADQDLLVLVAARAADAIDFGHLASSLQPPPAT